MSRLIMWNLITLDGMFEGPEPWDLRSHEFAWSDELHNFSMEQAEEIGGLIFGRRTYEGMAAHWSSATGDIADFMNSVPKYVFSRTLERADWANSTLVKEDAGEMVRRLKEQPGKDLFSSAAPISQLPSSDTGCSTSSGSGSYPSRSEGEIRCSSPIPRR